MSLSDLIRTHRERLVDEWASYASAQIKAAQALSRDDLRDSAGKLFGAIADDMEKVQSDKAQRDKSHGLRPGNSEAITRHALVHADARLAQGFSLLDLIAEYRAARASVMRLWAEKGANEATDAEEIIRFNEAIDEALNVSANSVEDQLHHGRDLFLGVLGHDMRSPLGAIMSGSQVLLKDDHLSPVSTKVSARIYSSCVRLRQMLDQLLDFTQTRLGRALTLHRQRTDLGATARHVIDELEAYHPASAFILERDGDLSGDWDAGRLAQVISNLGGNAVQHGRAERPITVRLQGLAGEVRVSVHNEGPIIPKELRARIFDPLTRGAGGRLPPHKGSIGLGLYICRQIVLAHGGTIEVASDAQGTTFRFTLPRETAPEAALALAPAPPRAAP